MASHSGATHAHPPILQWSPDKKHSERERWICIYPAYINNKKSVAEGRRIPKNRCVENPTYQEIRDVLVAAGLTVGVENKLYSRERSKELLYRGRIRVQLKNDDGAPCNPLFPTRDSVMFHLGDMIPKLKSRQVKPGGDQPAQASQGKGKSGKKGRR
ncbi:signal recognition particle 19 kDa protein [Anthonomus grandis grandis]|uniref:signal recognition particle 19 kDa protein n=1 Tax=Anthonomus grandis grandis TaxID=2921223 RepID=UPI002165FBCF|nr:signal recognition particle 19 kDa protein [Anthonomus grandis grandis]